MTRLRIAGRVDDSIVDGPGVRYALFTQGCPRACPGCHNPQTQPLEGGEEATVEAILAEIDANPLLDGVTFSGGEPFLQAAALAELARELKKRGLHRAAYTGYLWEELIEANDPAWNAFLAELDVVVDGPFVQALRSWTLKFAGSTNQRFIDVPRSLSEGRAVEQESWRS
ncbi:MAG: anaerobic ribonucleoside-triphosphate reductase activating protein [Thermoguttaceae bacterium]|nr:anaerobic ribonucleoside-triphosphate reductase activating protein [Thermoguttaceae bacterium]